MKNNKPSRLSIFLKILSVISTLICIYAGLQTFLLFEGSVPGTMLDFFHLVGLFFIGIGIFLGSFLWGLAALVDKG